MLDIFKWYFPNTKYFKEIYKYFTRLHFGYKRIKGLLNYS